MRERKESIERALGKVDRVIGVISGKGGVGKTTVAVNLSAYLAKNHSVALLDADISCPNANKFLGIDERAFSRENKISLIEKFGVKIASFAFLTDDETIPVIWRGPMLSNALREIIEKVNWEELDYLLVDLPPGTGDLPLTLMQELKPDGVIVVTSSQNISITDAKKSANMAKQLGVKVLGIVENMAGDIFGSGAGEKAAQELGVPFLGRIGLDIEISKALEKGKPFVLGEGEQAKNFEQIGEKIEKQLGSNDKD